MADGIEEFKEQYSYLNYLLERVWIIIWGKKPKKKRLAYERTSI